jgi:hypothetical protein
MLAFNNTELQTHPGKVEISTFLGPKRSVADPDPEGSETSGRIRIRFGTEIKLSEGGFFMFEDEAG